MLRTTGTRLFGAVLAVAAGILFAAPEAQALTRIINTATAQYANSNNTPMATVSGTTAFDSVSDPVLAVVKTANPVTGGPGTLVTWTVNVTYPKQVLGAPDPGLCNDDSIAKNVSVSDLVPAGFTYVAGSITLSIDGGAPASLTDASDLDAGSFGANTVTVALPNFNEGDGDSGCAGQNTKVKVITFQATKN